MFFFFLSGKKKKLTSQENCIASLEKLFSQLNESKLDNSEFEIMLADAPKGDS